MNFAIKLMAFCLLTLLSSCASFKPTAKQQPLPEIPTDIYAIKNIEVPMPEPELLADIKLPKPIRPLHERAVIRMTASEIDCVTSAIYFEARGESARGMAAVGYVILNRMGSGRYPPTACGVVHQKFKIRGVFKCQFSWSCTGPRNAPSRGKGYDRAREMAMQVMALEVENPIDDSIFFNHKRLRPAHTSRQTFRATIDNHSFFAAI